MGISYSIIIIFGLPLAYAYATHRQSVAGNSTFRGIVFCNFLNMDFNLFPPHIFPHMVTPTMFPVDKKRSPRKKSLGQICINSLVPYK